MLTTAVLAYFVVVAFRIESGAEYRAKGGRGPVVVFTLKSWHGTVSLWHVAVTGALLLKWDPEMHAVAMACETIKSVAHLLALKVLFGYLGPLKPTGK
jgi:hypothetical protein